LADVKKLHFVLGKGGVGKSTLAAALALCLQRRGWRVLGIELDAPGGFSRALGVELHEPNATVASDSGVFLSWFDGSVALAEYLSRKVRLGPLAKKLFENPVYDAFVRAAPGVRELMVVGKIRDELVLQENWDAVVVDAGASGHALEYLRMPGAAAVTFRRGRVHREALRVDGVLRDSKTTAIHVVTTAEEMPTLEAIESVTRIRDDLGLPLGLVIVNRYREVPPETIRPTLELLARIAPDAPMLLSGRRALGRIEIQERCRAHLERATGSVAARMPQLPEDEDARCDLDTLAGLWSSELG
jgi:anion-transporting  ArsA/GET3 family ATPase